MFDLFVLQHTTRRRVSKQFESAPQTREPVPASERKRRQPRRASFVTALRPSRAVADR
jgi:hypothetical protein